MKRKIDFIMVAENFNWFYNEINRICDIGDDTQGNLMVMRVKE